MGFELYLRCFGAAEKDGLPRDAVRSLFPVDDKDSEPDFWNVRYDQDNRCHIGVSPFAHDSTKLKGLYVDRPCEDLRLWNSLFAVLKMGAVVLFFPGGPLIIAREEDSAALPVQTTDSLNKPVCVDSGESIRRIVQVS